MEKTLNLDGREVRVDMSADTLRVYRKTFNRDLILDMLSMTENLDMEVLENLAYICAAACDPDIPPIDIWLRQFSPTAIYQAAGELMKMWRHNEKTTSQSRKKKVDR